MTDRSVAAWRPPRSSRPASRDGDRWVALVLAGLGVVLLVGASRIEFGVGYDRIGPRFFPYLVAVGSVLVGAWVWASATGRPAGTLSAPHAAGEAISWRGLGYMGLALVLTVLIAERAGFVPAATAQFWLVARATGSRRPLRDGLVAALLSTAVYVLFSRGLGLTLPAGVLF